MSENFIPLSVPNLNGNELNYITHAVKTEWVSTGGPYIEEFEQKIAAYVNAKGAVSCQSGTSGLHIALQVCGVTELHEVIVPTLTFIAAVNPVKYLGADPVFMDCDDTLCMDPDKLKEFCEKECVFKDNKLINKITSKHIKAIVVVHVFGNLCDMEKINGIANSYNLTVIEDATEALGSYYLNGRYKGMYAGTVGNIGVFSFNGNKIMTTGGGGMIVSNDEKLLTLSKHLTTQAKSDDLYYTHDEVGYNYRMTNLQAALGLAQLEKLEEFISTKTMNFKIYLEGISQIQNLSLLQHRTDIRSNYWFYAMVVNKDYPMNRHHLIKYLAEKKIQVRPIWGLIHQQKPYINNQSYKIEKAYHYLESVLNIPCSSNLSQKEILRVLESLDFE
ncbi:LegC family aminotransferase [Planococcus sp. A6]|uniref:LegC family aminotransferase n=1 Tax=Planococcus sp. A6 TaxID=2992760 RepID=UPI00237AF5CF|nr:LegC family aminotransferase [Planococcus sp. A6]MDE0582103.1 LegC family aminotransferase [Planococcus sp. A6]